MLMSFGRLNDRELLVCYFIEIFIGIGDFVGGWIFCLVIVFRGDFDIFAVEKELKFFEYLYLLALKLSVVYGFPSVNSLSLPPYISFDSSSISL